MSTHMPAIYIDENSAVLVPHLHSKLNAFRVFNQFS